MTRSTRPHSPRASTRATPVASSWNETGFFSSPHHPRRFQPGAWRSSLGKRFLRDAKEIQLAMRALEEAKKAMDAAKGEKQQGEKLQDLQKAVENIDHAHQEGIDPSAAVARNESNGGAKHYRDTRRRKADHQGDRSAEKASPQRRAAERVVAEPAGDFVRWGVADAVGALLVVIHRRVRRKRPWQRQDAGRHHQAGRYRGAGKT